MKRTLMSCAVASLLVSGSALAAWPENQSKSLSPGAREEIPIRLHAWWQKGCKRVESECQRGESHGRCWGGWP